MAMTDEGTKLSERAFKIEGGNKKDKRKKYYGKVVDDGSDWLYLYVHAPFSLAPWRWLLMWKL